METDQVVELVDQWAEEHQAEIVAALQHQQQRRETLAQRLSLSKDPQSAWKKYGPGFANKNLCGAWEDIHPPKDFQVRDKGKVGFMIPELDLHEPVIPEDGHIFASEINDPDNPVIVCLTPGQYVRNWLEVEVDDGMAYLANRAPNLVHQVSEELVILRGRSQEIADRLGIHYLPY
jgi:hypothetical protein